MRNIKFLLPLLAILVFSTFIVASADDDIEVTLSIDYTCDEVGVEIDTDAGTGPFSLRVDFGDEDESIEVEVDALPHLITHTYPGQGEYEISVKIIDSFGLEGEIEREVLIEGPEVTLESEPFPPLVTLEGGEATVAFTALVDGGNAPFTFEWDLDGDDSPEAVDPLLNSTEFTYTEAGKYKASVSVTDDCGFSDSDKLTVMVLDDEDDGDESEGGDKACHPMAERIAQAVSNLTDGSGTYTCEDIFAIFRGVTNGGTTIGFGRLWHAYKLASVIPDLTWEEVRDWKLEGNSWGLLNQVSKFAETINEVGIRDLFDLVLSGENSLAEIRSAMRMSLRFEVDFYDALTRAGEGASNGEMGQYYKLLQEMDIEPVALDGFLASGSTLSDIRHAHKLSTRTGLELDEILTAHGNGSGWGEINQAHRLAQEGASVEEILAVGVNEYRRQLREQDRLERTAEREDRMLEKIADQYGVSREEVSSQLSVCGGDWACVRAYFRELSKPKRGKK